MYLVAYTIAIAAAATDSFQRVELSSGNYLMARAEGVSAEVRLPLVICLHGTDDDAEDALAFWSSLETNLPYIFAAPQGRFAGWRESDLPLLREMLDHLQNNVAYDPHRVLLAGHSAGGAMAFHLLYVEGFPATAVAVTANYVPPNVTADQARARAGVPVFYAVGVRDLNHERMRDGAALLREAGVRITMRRPDIGHVQDRQVGQQALDWFENVCRERVQAAILQAQKGAELGGAIGGMLAELEGIVGNAPAHFDDQVGTARALASRLERPGRDRLESADRLFASEKWAEARAEYAAIERTFEPASIAALARAARLRLDERAESAPSPSVLQSGEAAEAERLWAMIEAAMDDSQPRKAAKYCRELVLRYPRSEQADEAASLLRTLQGNGG